MRAMQVDDVGEARLIEVLSETIGDATGAQPAAPDIALTVPIGDDASVWQAPAGATALTTDTMVEGVHFALGTTSWGDLGWKAMAVNLSDIAAMGCRPLYSVVSLGLRGDLPVSGLIEMYQGMLEASRVYGGAVVGGDIVRSPALFVAVSMAGAVPQGQQPLRRSTAAAGEAVAVTGSLGCSAGGLRLLVKGSTLDQQTSTHLSSAHNRPVPRVEQGMLLARHGVSAAIDVSDGLVDDLGKLCQASAVGGRVRSASVPADEFVKRAYPDDWQSLALSGGEDYELLFTAHPRVMAAVIPLLDVPASIIGEIVDGPPEVTVLDEVGKVVPLERGGWDHFARVRR